MHSIGVSLNFTRMCTVEFVSVSRKLQMFQDYAILNYPLHDIIILTCVGVITVQGKILRNYFLF